MGTLSGQTIAGRYTSLLKTNSDSTLTSSVTALQDGAGNDSDLQIATNKVNVATSLGVSRAAPSYKLDINGTTNAFRIDNGTNVSLIAGKGNTFGFCAGDCNPAATVGGGSAGSTTAQTTGKTYIAIDPTAHSGNGSTIINNEAGDGTGSIGIGQNSLTTGFIHFGDADKKFYFEARSATQAFDIYGNSTTLFSVDGNNKRIGMGTSAPNNTLEIKASGSAKGNIDMLALTNSISNADMDGTETSILFNQFYYDASTPAIADAGRISVGTESDWTSTTSTQDAYMAFETAVNGTVTERLRVASTGYVGIGTTSPTATLHVAGNIVATGSISSDVIIEPSERYKLEEYFSRKPQSNATMVIDADANDAVALAKYVKANRHFELLGTNADDAKVTYNATKAGINLETNGGNAADSMIILPHLDYLTAQNAGAQTAWTGVLWGTENSVEWSCAITTDSNIADHRIYAGLKLTNDSRTAIDNDQAYFYYDNSKTLLTYQTVTDTWHFCHSIGGTDYIVNTGLSVATDTSYRFRISIDASRQVTIFINDVQYGVATVSNGDTGVNVNNAGGYGTSGSTVAMTVDGTDATTKFVVGDVVSDADGNIVGTVSAVATTTLTLSSCTHAVADDEDLYLFGTKAATSTTASAALTNDVDLIPYIGIQKHTNTTARNLVVHYEKISRKLFE
jgi:hypothetical protein